MRVRPPLDRLGLSDRSWDVRTFERRSEGPGNDEAEPAFDCIIGEALPSFPGASILLDRAGIRGMRPGGRRSPAGL